jgi:hypothetical protein
MSGTWNMPHMLDFIMFFIVSDAVVWAQQQAKSNTARQLGVPLNIIFLLCLTRCSFAGGPKLARVFC